MVDGARRTARRPAAAPDAPPAAGPKPGQSISILWSPEDDEWYRAKVVEVSEKRRVTVVYDLDDKKETIRLEPSPDERTSPPPTRGLHRWKLSARRASKRERSVSQALAAAAKRTRRESAPAAAATRRSCDGCGCTDKRLRIIDGAGRLCADCAGRGACGEFCPVCRELWEDDEEMVCCDQCEKWVHTSCDGLKGKAAVYAQQDLAYRCPDCRGSAPREGHVSMPSRRATCQLVRCAGCSIDFAASVSADPEGADGKPTGAIREARGADLQFCDACEERWAEGEYCPVCYELWGTSDEVPMTQCDGCVAAPPSKYGNHLPNMATSARPEGAWHGHVRPGMHMHHQLCVIWEAVQSSTVLCSTSCTRWRQARGVSASRARSAAPSGEAPASPTPPTSRHYD